ncbi:uncharacterized protein LOC135495330 [Lineus longissimus]|uniref:uncharacterized protein LOC135495330 n=1 Tax=Lineus longissimus TaxID=88925 RepID=UPI00315CE120
MTRMNILLVLACCVVLGYCNVAFTGFRNGQIAYEALAPSDDGLYRIRVTDGKAYIEAYVSKDSGMKRCTVSYGKNLVSSMLKADDIQYATIGAKAVFEMIDNCQRRELAIQYRQARVVDLWRPVGENSTIASGSAINPLIAPGTKWCGADNVAEHYHDLGTENATDSCCREHDHCNYFINAFDKKYNYQSLRPHTIVHCECDEKFKDCLTAVDTTFASELGKTFFDRLFMECFTLEERTYCAQRHWTQLWCTRWAKGTTAVVQDSGSWDGGNWIVG